MATIPYEERSRKGRIREEVINSNNLCLFTDWPKYPTTGKLSILDLRICDSSVYMVYSDRTHKDVCSSDYFPIISKNTEPNEDGPCRSKLKWTDWERINSECPNKKLNKSFSRNSYCHSNRMHTKRRILRQMKESIVLKICRDAITRRKAVKNQWYSTSLI